ncbi:MAG TPA: hypothetical protein DDW94_08510 [Deltaproteobacteria bacterium]|nr:MAG: hypothetical protein A2Z79_03030 [Deltaproteobacteria bacterium GWA2_55_82]OGQ62258.1 MAG: hypothetical protein A3I81_04940 [Deltaproteobacteria bacterium RIFCSPLOWO2_02_FULL_55_12]OIJ74369.1 MAG: hypothetical protein A2V21_308930 [Deltaproteobacteria bacterium GWC2_55_46]HBG47015.1 hypothetical protein [Deltaproteobacteria bacterium]HCY10925.1 hypothetical protein [Deltaproteobacteria bacterium]
MSTAEDIREKLLIFGLTPRQQEVAILAMRGLSNREIAGKLFVTEQTVKDHLHDIFRKARVHRRSEFTAKVLETFFQATI